MSPDVFHTNCLRLNRLIKYRIIDEKQALELGKLLVKTYLSSDCLRHTSWSAKMMLLERNL